MNFSFFKDYLLVINFYSYVKLKSGTHGRVEMVGAVDDARIDASATAICCRDDTFTLSERRRGKNNFHCLHSMYPSSSWELKFQGFFNFKNILFQNRYPLKLNDESTKITAEKKYFMDGIK